VSLGLLQNFFKNIDGKMNAAHWQRTGNGSGKLAGPATQHIFLAFLFSARTFEDAGYAFK
jgi:hypothetical protein